jgi:hypothetical protein
MASFIYPNSHVYTICSALRKVRGANTIFLMVEEGMRYKSQNATFASVVEAIVAATANS